MRPSPATPPVTAGRCRYDTASAVRAEVQIIGIKMHAERKCGELLQEMAEREESALNAKKGNVAGRDIIRNFPG